MRGTTRTVAVAAISAAALIAAGCGGGSSDTGSSSGAGTSGGEITIRGCNPQNPLIPSNTTETCGGNIIDAFAAKLVHYNAEDAKPEMDIAESIETTDNQTFTVKMKKGYKFQDGTEVKAKNFIDAWNFAAYGPNAQSSGYFMEPIEGFEDTQCTGPAKDAAGKDIDPCLGEGKAKVDKLTGLAATDDYTFTIKTTEKVSNLPVRLGYSAFSPLPDSFFKDPKAFGEKPVGAGPYQVESWTKNQSVVLKKFADYSGKFAGQLDKITFKIYQDSDAAYNDVIANQLDITDEIPTSALIDDKYKQDLPDRNAQKATGVIQTVTFAPVAVDPAYAKPEVRKAISMAINRDEIIKKIFNNTRVPATGWVSPVVDGYKADACGEACTFDAAKAKAALAAAGGFQGAITLSYNADASHKDWTEATCNSIKNALGVDCQAVGVVDFKTFRSEIKARTMKGMFRTGWQMDYPSIENFLAPIFKTKASSNDGDYSNPAFDKLLVDAAAATDPAAANAKYQEAEAILGQDFPAIPMWYGKTTMGWSDKVTNVKITAFGTIDLPSVKLK